MSKRFFVVAAGLTAAVLYGCNTAPEVSGEPVQVESEAALLGVYDASEEVRSATGIDQFVVEMYAGVITIEGLDASGVGVSSMATQVVDGWSTVTFGHGAYSTQMAIGPDGTLRLDGVEVVVPDQTWTADEVAALDWQLTDEQTAVFDHFALVNADVLVVMDDVRTDFEVPYWQNICDNLITAAAIAISAEAGACLTALFFPTPATALACATAAGTALAAEAAALACVVAES